MHFPQAPLKADIRIASLYPLCADAALSALPAIASICGIRGGDWPHDTETAALQR